jgi:hypothetical protein
MANKLLDRERPVPTLITVLALLASAKLQGAQLQNATNTLRSTSTKTRSFVRLVIAEREMTFEGTPVTWDTLPTRLETLPNRSQMILEFAVATETLTVKQLNQAQARARQLTTQLGFEHLDYVGVQPLGSKGPFSIKIATSEPEADFKLVQEYLKRALDVRTNLIELRHAQYILTNAWPLYNEKAISEEEYNKCRRKVEFHKAALRTDRLAILKLELEAAEEELRRVIEIYRTAASIGDDAGLRKAQRRVDLLKLELQMYQIYPEACGLAEYSLEFQQAEFEVKTAQQMLAENAISTNQFLHVQQRFESAKLQFQFVTAELARAKGRKAETNLESIRKRRATDERSEDELKQRQAAVALLRSEEQKALLAILQSAQQHLDPIAAAHREGLVPESEYLNVKRAIDLLQDKVNSVGKTR